MNKGPIILSHIKIILMNSCFVSSLQIAFNSITFDFTAIQRCVYFLLPTPGGLDVVWHVMYVLSSAITGHTFCVYEGSALTFKMGHQLKEAPGKSLDFHPQIHAELDDVVGRSRVPSIQDKSKLPFLNATILETQRFGNITPFR